MSSWLDLLEGIAGRENIESARREESEGNDPAEFLCGRSVPPKAILSAMSRHYRLPAVNLERYHPSYEAMSLIKEEVARRFFVLPIFRLKDQLFVAISNPDDYATTDYLRQLTGLSIETVLALRRSIENAINREFIRREKTAKAAEPEKAEKKDDSMPLGEITLEDTKAPVIRMVEHIIARGLQMGASDIHLEPYENEISLRYRVDGILHEFPSPPADMYAGVVARTKIISNLDLAEKRKPQDGRIRYTLNGREYDLRVSILPGLAGEGIVMRILDTSGDKKDLRELGFSAAMLRQFEKMIAKPYGLILVTGPTGSGKSTTLYATLKRILTPEKKFITLEDPVEYQQRGIHQVQVHDDIGFTFTEGLRSILRHDPDVVMLGEIRDEKSAEIAIRASMTGHMVFSTLHTNDAPSAVTRLIDMGVQSYLVLSSLTSVLAQRLLRRLCPECKRPMSLDAAHMESLGLQTLPEGATIYEPVGCGNCNNLGYRGRVAVYELLEISPAMRTLTRERCSPEGIRELTRAGDFTTLRDDAVEKLFSGLTSLDEVVRLTIE